LAKVKPEEEKKPKEISRRQFLRDVELFAGGAALGSIALVSAGAAEAALQSVATTAPLNYPAAKSAVSYNSKVCDMCMACAAICSMRAWEGESNPQLGGVKVSFDNMYGQILDSRVCRQCVAPSCMQACTFEAIAIDAKTGARVIDRKKCTGCRSCEKACPFNAVVYNKAANKCFKCDLCAGEALCVKHCPSGALSLVGGA
jgi:carbon-monoxide dehydrogenase iron sulfur subunit